MSAPDLTESQTTFPSDSEIYDANHSNSNDSDEPASSSSSPMILYSPPTFWSLMRGAAINLLLPFVNGLMLGFGELFAHEAAYRLGWGKTKVCWIIERDMWRRDVDDAVTQSGEDARRGPTNQETKLTGHQVFPSHRTHSLGPGIEVKDDPVERTRRDGRELDMYTALE